MEKSDHFIIRSRGSEVELAQLCDSLSGSLVYLESDGGWAGIISQPFLLTSLTTAAGCQ